MGYNIIESDRGPFRGITQPYSWIKRRKEKICQEKVSRR